MQSISGNFENKVNSIYEDFITKVPKERISESVTYIMKRIDSIESKVNLENLEQERLTFYETFKGSSKKKKPFEDEDIYSDIEDHYMFKLNESLSSVHKEEEEEKYIWFFLNDEEGHFNRNEWVELKENDMIEYAYQQYLKSIREENANEFYNYATYSNKSKKIEIDFVNNIKVSCEDKSFYQKLGRFKGNPNQKKNLINSLLEISFKWYFSSNDSPTDKIFWTPYKLEENVKIETRFKNFYLNKVEGKYLGQGFEIDFNNFVEKSLVDGKTKMIGRFDKCPRNIIRRDYFYRDLKPEIYKSNFSGNDSRSNACRKCYLVFKNLFPSRYYSKAQKFSFYYKSKSNSIILYLSSGWSFDENEERFDKDSSFELIDKLRSEGYRLIFEIDKDKERIDFLNSNKFSIKMMKSMIKTKWYQKLDENNEFLWVQLSPKVNLEIEKAYKNKFLLIGDSENIEIEDLDLVVNFVKNKIIKDNKVTSIMRLNLKNGFPEKIYFISVPEEIYNKVKHKNEKLKLENQQVLYANQFGPTNIKELINEIRKEIKTEGCKLGLDDSVQAYDKLYLQSMNNSNFINNILKIYSEEGFVYIYINKLLREKDYENLFKMRYFYFSLLYCFDLNPEKSIDYPLYKPVCLRQEQEEFYKSLIKGQLIVINEFLSTTGSNEISNLYTLKGQRCVIFEITSILKSSFVLKMEQLSRFPSEKEVLIQSGSIFKFEDIVESNGSTIIKLNLIIDNSKLFDSLLSISNPDFTFVKLDYFELNYLFKSLNNNLQIKETSLKINEDALIPYFSEKIALNKTLQHITITKEGEYKSNKFFTFSRPQKCSINLKNFNKKEFSTFIESFVRKANIEYLSLPNFYEESLYNLGKSLSKNNDLKRLEINLISKEVYGNLNYITSSISLNYTLKELYLRDFYLSEEAVIHIGIMIEENCSLEKLDFKMNYNVDLNEISRQIRLNKTLKEITISFSTKNLVNKRIIQYEGTELISRRVTLNNIYNSKFIVMLSQLLLVNLDVIYLNLSNNQLNWKYSKLLVDIINDNCNLRSIDLSNNYLCDIALQEILSDIYGNTSLREINLENNIITSTGYQLIKDISQVQFKLKYNYIGGLIDQRQLLDEYTDKLCVRILNDHSSYIYSLIQLPDGKIASGSYDTSIKIWDPNDNYKCVNTLKGHTDGVYSLLLISDEALASGSGDKSIRIWDIKNQFICLKVLIQHTEIIYSLLLLNDGMFASGSRDSTIKIWDTKKDYQSITTLEGHHEAVLCLIILSKDVIVSGSYDKTLRVWESQKNFKCTQIVYGHNDGIYSLVSLNNEKIVSGSRDTTIKVWDTLNNYSCVYTLLGHADYVYSIVKLADGKLASGSGDSTIKIWDPLNSYKNVETIKGHKDAVISLLVMSEGKLISGSYDSTIRIWDNNYIYQSFETLKGHDDHVYCLQQLSDGKIASGSGDTVIKIWDPKYNYNCVKTLAGHSLSVFCLALLSDGNLASGSLDNSIKIWDIQDSFNCIYTIKHNGGAVLSLLVLPDGKIASGFYDFNIRIWDPSDEYTCCRVLEGHKDVVLCFLFISNGKLLSGSGDKTIRIWDNYMNHLCINTLQGHSDSVLSLVLVSDNRVASGSYDKTIRIWDFNNKYSCIKIIEGHSNYILTLLVLSDGRLASGSGDKSIKIWDSSDNYNCLQTLEGHTEYIYSIIQMSNGNLVSGSGDKCIRIWLK